MDENYTNTKQVDYYWAAFLSLSSGLVGILCLYFFILGYPEVIAIISAVMLILAVICGIVFGFYNLVKRGAGKAMSITGLIISVALSLVVVVGVIDAIRSVF